MAGKMRSVRCLMAVSKWSHQFFGMSFVAIFSYSLSPKLGVHSHLSAFSRMPSFCSKNPLIHGEYTAAMSRWVPISLQKLQTSSELNWGPPSAMNVVGATRPPEPRELLGPCRVLP